MLNHFPPMRKTHFYQRAPNGRHFSTQHFHAALCRSENGGAKLTFIYDMFMDSSRIRIAFWVVTDTPTSEKAPRKRSRRRSFVNEKSTTFTAQFPTAFTHLSALLYFIVLRGVEKRRLWTPDVFRNLTVCPYCLDKGFYHSVLFLGKWAPSFLLLWTLSGRIRSYESKQSRPK